MAARTMRRMRRQIMRLHDDLDEATIGNNNNNNNN